MAIHTPITGTPANASMIHMMELERAYAAFTDFMSDMRKANDGTYSRRANWSYLELLEALEHAFQFDASEHLDHVRTELNIDAEGYTLDSDGEPTEHRIHTPISAFGREERAA